MNRKKFAKYTEKIRSMLPFWFSMKKQPNESVGLQFLNIFGMQLDDIYNILNYAYEQTKIESIDNEFTDILYKVILPVHYEVKYIKMVSSYEADLYYTDNLYEFLNLDKSYKIDDSIKQPNYYYIDKAKKIIYVREEYDKDSEFPHGRLQIMYGDKLEHHELVIHHVWNFLDEFGALVGCTRLYNENNKEYKDRILDVFRYPANSTKFGLANGIARELGIRKHIKVENSREILLNDQMIITNTITVNGDSVQEHEVFIDNNGRIIIKLDNIYQTKELEISYISGLELTPLIDLSNKLSNELYKADGTPTELLLKYINHIKENSSILWNDFVYDEALWVKDEKEFTENHFAFIPTKFDASIKGFAKYKKYR